MNKNLIFCLVVMTLLRDKDNPSKIYQPGETLQTEDLKRVNDLIGRKLAVLKDVLVPVQDGSNDGLSNENVNVGDSEYHYEAVKKALEALEGVKSAEVSHTTGTAVVTLEKEISDDVLKQAVTGQGYQVTDIH